MKEADLLKSDAYADWTEGGVVLKSYALDSGDHVLVVEFPHGDVQVQRYFEFGGKIHGSVDFEFVKPGAVVRV